MDKFIELHAGKISGSLSCFDRVLFRGYLPIMSGAAMALFLKSQNIGRESLKPFLLEQAARLKDHAQSLCTRTGRPYQYLGQATRKEDMARKMAKRDGITEGLVCVLSVVEPCRTFSLVWNGRSPYVQSSQRKCLQLYYYFMDRDLGLIHVKLQTWFPFRIQVYVNGHEWLARQLDHHNVKYIKVDNAFLHLGDVVRAQGLADGFARIDWIHVLVKDTVLRVETVINDPEEFRVRKQVRRDGKTVMAWVPLRKSVTMLFRYREIAAQSNVRYLDALSQVQDPTLAVRDLDALTTNASTKDGRTAKAFNPLSRNERMLFEVLLAGEYTLHGFTNRDVRHKLAHTAYPLASEAEKQPGQVTRLFRRLHAHGLSAKIPHSRRWRVSLAGRRTMTTAIKLREVAYPSLFAAAA
jgi:hypothetical protein